MILSTFKWNLKNQTLQKSWHCFCFYEFYAEVDNNCSIIPHSQLLLSLEPQIIGLQDRNLHSAQPLLILTVSVPASPQDFVNYSRNLCQFGYLTMSQVLSVTLIYKKTSRLQVYHHNFSQTIEDNKKLQKKKEKKKRKNLH